MKIGLLADAHGNAEAFALGVANLLDRGAANLYFLGDAVGYLPGPSVITRISELDIECVMGNHEAMLLAGSVENDDVYRLEHTRALMSESDRSLIQGWPQKLEIEAACGRLIMVHGTPSDPLYGYLYEDGEATELEGGRPTTVFMGATHRPFVRTEGTTTFVNVGSCGLPRDCGALGSACLFDDETGAATIFRFDIKQATAEALNRCGPVADVVAAVFDRHGDCFGELP